MGSRLADEVQCGQKSLNEGVTTSRHLPDKQIKFEYSLHQQTLEQVQSAKYLGITITDDLDWGQHISEISSKATRTLGFLRRNLAFAPRQTKDVAYKKHWFALNLNMHHPFGIPMLKLIFSRWSIEDGCSMDLSAMEK